MKNLKGCNAVVTGASRGLGRHIAQTLAGEGVNIALVARSAAALQKVSKEVESSGVKTAVIPADLTDSDQIRLAAEKSEKLLGPIDILVNNAGVEHIAPFEEYPPDEIVKVVELNLMAAMLLSRQFLQGMLKRGRGHIVNMASLAGKTGIPYQTPYATTKAGLVMFSQSLRTELKNEPVGVSVICPGFVADEGMYANMEKAGAKAPRLLKPTTVEKVTEAVVRSIKKDLAEVVVNPLPMRPGFLLREMFPGIVPYIHQIIGSTEFVRTLFRKRKDSR